MTRFEHILYLSSFILLFGCAASKKTNQQGVVVNEVDEELVNQLGLTKIQLKN